MARAQLTNNAVTTLASGITNVATSLTVSSGAGALFPSSGYFYVTLSTTISVEIVRCTSRTGDVLTVTRGQEGTAGTAFLTGDKVSLNLTAAVVNELAPLDSPTLVTPVLGVATGTSFNSITALSSTLPVVAGTAAIGVGTTTARGDHVHPVQTSVSGNAGSVTNATLTTALTVNTGTVTLAGNVANTSVLTIGAGAVSVSGSNSGDQVGGTPALTLGTANTAGSSPNFLRRDDTILVFDATVPVVAATAATGSATVAARRDHVHPVQTSVTGNAGSVSNATLTTALTVNTGTVTLTGNVANTSVLTIGAGASTISGSHTGTSSGSNTGDQTGGTPAIVLGTTNTAGTSPNFLRRDDTILAFDATVPVVAGTAATGSATVAARRDHVHPAQTTITGNAGTVTTNANLTGPITSSGNTTSVLSQTGTGSTFVMNTSPTLVTPVLGVATATSLQGIIGNVTPAPGTFTDLTASKFLGYSEAVTTATISAGTYNIDMSLGNVFNFTLNTSCTFTFTNPPASGTLRSASIILTQGTGGSRTATFTGAKYTDGVVPVLSTTVGQIDMLTFFTINGGTSYFGQFAMANIS